jgi:hypothetical protein
VKFFEWLGASANSIPTGQSGFAATATLANLDLVTDTKGRVAIQIRELTE